MLEALVLTKQLSKTYLRGRQHVSAILDVNLAVQPGEFVALIGRSGSGKSTLLSLLGGLDVPTAGQVIIAGTDLSVLNPKRSAIFRRQQIGFLFQSVDLLPTLTVLENVMLPAALAGTNVVEYTEQAWRLLDAVGIQPLVDKLPDQLSGGERQRVGIARALINHPRLILADEPTGSLDRSAGQSVIDLLKQMTREQQTTVILATHDPEVTRQADRLMTIDDGRILLAHQ
ncbi:ABC transporter ATP-binding protein [soil metagenome]